MSHVVNAAIEKRGGRYVVNDSAPIFVERKRKTKTQSIVDTNVGDILEVAQMKCGGAAGLASAVARGDVTKINRNGKTFYVVPQFELKQTESIEEEHEAKRFKEIEADHYDTIAEFTAEHSWSLDHSSSGSGHQKAEVLSSGAEQGDEMEKLNKVWAELSKVYKICDKSAQKIMASQTQSSVQQAIIFYSVVSLL